MLLICANHDDDERLTQVSILITNVSSSVSLILTLQSNVTQICEKVRSFSYLRRIQA